MPHTCRAVQSNFRPIERPISMAIVWQGSRHGIASELGRASQPTRTSKDESMLVTSSSPNATSYDHPLQKTADPRQAHLLPSLDGRPRSRERHFGQASTQAYRLLNRPMVEKTNQDVEIHPADVVKRHIVTWDGMAAEIVHATRRNRMD